MMELVSEYCNVETEHIYIYEQVTEMFKQLKKHAKILLGSEYINGEYESGFIMENGIRHEDAMNLSFSDEQFKCIISQDVFEHVSDIKKALYESRQAINRTKSFFVKWPTKSH